VPNNIFRKIFTMQTKSAKRTTRADSHLLRELMIEIKEPTGIRDLGIDEEEFRQKSPTIVNFSANDLNTAVSPRTPATREFTTILEYMLKEKPIDF
jgi:alcohol dehydrogenase class IV